MNKKILRLRTGNKTRTILQRKYLAWEEHWGKGRKFSHRENIGFVGGGLGEDIIVWFYNIKGGIQSKDKEDLFSLHNHRMWRKDTVCWGIYMQRSTKPEQRKKQGNTFFLSIFIRKATMTTFNCSNIEPWTRLTMMSATRMLTDCIWLPSTNFGWPKHSKKWPAANFRLKGVWSPMLSHHLTFYDPSQYLSLFPSNSAKE